MAKDVFTYVASGRRPEYLAISDLGDGRVEVKVRGPRGILGEMPTACTVLPAEQVLTLFRGLYDYLAEKGEPG